MCLDHYQIPVTLPFILAIIELKSKGMFGIVTYLDVLNITHILQFRKKLLAQHFLLSELLFNYT